MKLDFGGIGRYMNDVKTVNIDPDSGADYLCDITDINQMQLFFRQESVEVISCFHTLEHLPVDKIYSSLMFWRTLLTKTGRLHIVVPDIHHTIMDYATGRICFEVMASILYNRTPYKKRSSYQQHYWSWTEVTLASDLLRCGYEFVTPFGNSIHPGTWLFRSPGFEDYEEFDKYEFWNLRLTAFRTKPK